MTTAEPDAARASLATRSFLGLSALVWLPYGLYCLARPAFLEEAAGVRFTSPTGASELRAMYGGLQAAVGVLAGAAIARPSLVRVALTALAFLCGGLAAARGIGLLLDGGASAYTFSALAFELASLSLALVLVRRGASG